MEVERCAYSRSFHPQEKSQSFIKQLLEYLRRFGELLCKTIQMELLHATNRKLIESKRALQVLVSDNMKRSQAAHNHFDI